MKYSDENQGKFEATMEVNNWLAVRDIFGNIIQWEHERTGRKISNVDALAYWEAAQSAPAPF